MSAIILKILGRNLIVERIIPGGKPEPLGISVSWSQKYTT